MLKVIADLSDNNPNLSPKGLDFGLAYEKGLRAVIHKATEGTYHIDRDYAVRKKQAKRAGLMWGAYHFGVGGNGKEQAAFFLQHVTLEPLDLLVLDLETNITGTRIDMSLAEAEEFVLHIFEKTNRYPGLYTRTNFLHGRVSENSILCKCWLWLAHWDVLPPKVPAGWAHWTMWQYTNGTANRPPRPLPGIGVCDLDSFNGDIDGLKRLWGYPASAPAADALAAPALRTSTANALATPLPAAASANPASPMQPTAPAPVEGSPPQAGVWAASLRAIQQELPKLLLTVAGGVPLAKALHTLVVLPIESIKTAMSQLLAPSKHGYLLHALVIAGCYVARLVAAKVAQRNTASAEG